MIFCVIGTLGSGKSLVCVGRIYDALKAGKKVATNMNLRLEHLTVGQAPTHVIRIPDYPTVEDLRNLGIGNTDYDESKNGVIVLDELAMWLNNREWQKEGRKELIDWLIMSRRWGWDIYFIVQKHKMLDPQIRDALIEHLVICKRLDRVPIPLIGWLFKMVGLSGKLMRVHLATVLYGTSPSSPVSERWWYRGVQFFRAYDTRQKFGPEHHRPWLWCKTQPTPLVQGASQFLDLYRAPWLKERWALASRLVQWCERKNLAWLGRLVDLVSSPRQYGLWFDAWMTRQDPDAYLPTVTAKLPAMLQARAGRPGRLGAEGGEAAEPSQPEHLQAEAA